MANFCHILLMIDFLRPIRVPEITTVTNVERPSCHLSPLTTKHQQSQGRHIIWRDTSEFRHTYKVLPIAHCPLNPSPSFYATNKCHPGRTFFQSFHGVPSSKNRWSELILSNEEINHSTLDNEGQDDSPRADGTATMDEQRSCRGFLSSTQQSTQHS